MEDHRSHTCVKSSTCIKSGPENDHLDVQVRNRNYLQSVLLPQSRFPILFSKTFVGVPILVSILSLVKTIANAKAMLTRSLFALHTIISWIPYSEASPVRPDSSSWASRRDTGDCNDLKHNLTSSCWDELNMSGYLAQWWESNGAGCTQQNTGFASCYQQMAGWEQQQCDTTGPNMCSFPGDFTGYTPQQTYTLYTIFAIWQWFESIYEAIENADLSAEGPVGQIVKAVNPEVQKEQSLGDLFQALTATTPLLTLPADVSKLSRVVVETALRQSPGVLKQLNPTGTLDSEITQISDIYNGLSLIKTTYQQNVSTALALVQHDFTTFNTFAANGSFIAPRSNLQADTQNLTSSLETYIVSQCLTASNIIITLARDTNPQALAHNGSMTTKDLISCDSYDEYGVCSAWWYDPASTAAFGLLSLADPRQNYYDLMQTIFSAGWTKGADLFLGALSCADYVAANGGNSTPTLDTVTMAPRCISNTQICVWSNECELTDATCEFTGEYGWDLCKPTRGFLDEDCGGDGNNQNVIVPAPYLGPLDTTQNPDLIVCNGSK